jgi:hypothetical protein
MSHRTRWLAVLSGIGLALAMATQAFAYGPQVPTTITVTPSSDTFLCGHPEAVFATVLDQDGLPIKDVIVTWSFASSPSSDDRILQVTSKTNKDGVARTMVRLACVAGDRVIRATAGGVSGTAVIHVDLDRPGGGVLGITSRLLPNTATATGTIAPDSTPTGFPAPIVPIGAALMVAAALILRRVLSRR